MSFQVNFDLSSDFYAQDPQFPIIFEGEYNTVPSKIMWALMLYSHPSSKYYTLDPKSRIELIAKDYLKGPFDPTQYQETLDKIDRFLMTRAERLLTSWETKLEERNDFIKSKPYNDENYAMLDSIMDKTFNMWQNYRQIYDVFLKENESKTHGNIQESLTEQGAI